jgi:hypothetical protein
LAVYCDYGGEPLQSAKILIGSPLSQAAEILFPAISACIHQQSLPAYSKILR